MSKTLLDKARTNYHTCNILLERATDDEELLNIVGYHLQQTVELALKFLLEINGAEYPKVHDIGQLINIARNHNIALDGSDDYIEDHADMFTTWEVKTRYILNYSLNLQSIQKAMPHVGAFLDFVNEQVQEQMQESALPEMTEMDLW